ncbi:MAG: tRNA (N(6)-L-threonylcarbamoyladenosine(37)-C(2))-methylthiotransferase MtaB [Proteobacteria bacterium]|nr:tRNA (N(6)-L-threonylcarbamoyladenosine(37)-C(2))-methylthiotransferase MtaB [Pseudomonadota bacterium]
MRNSVVTFGCRLNAYESEAIRHLAGAAGLDEAIIVNTCAVTGTAVRQARQAIRRLRHEHPRAPIVVTGCAAQIEPATFARMPQVDRVLGNAEKLDLAAWRRAGARIGPRADGAAAADKVDVGDIMREQRVNAPMIDGVLRRARAFVQVQNGCDHRCTFCVIPFGRGNSRSLPMDGVIAQVRRLVESGYREIVLTGVDITSYGAGLPGAPRLGTLVGRVLRAAPELARLRLSSIDAVEADRELVEAFASEPRLMPHLHLSLQAGDDMILKRMRRRHRRADALGFCATLRRLRPDIVFGADIIAGFPTETADMFARSLDLVDECGLTYLHVFPYSPRPGTPASRMPALAPPLVKERAARLRAKGDSRLQRHLDAQVGTTTSVLIEGRALGHTEQFTPIRLPAPAPPGTLARLAVAGHDGRRLIAA